MQFHEITHVYFFGHFQEIFHNMIHFERLTEVFKMVRPNFFLKKTNILLQFDRNLTQKYKCQIPLCKHSQEKFVN